MAGLTITDVKIVGMCSKHRKEGDEVMKDKHGRIYRDDELSCIGCAIGCEKVKPVHAIQCNKCLKILGISWEEIKCKTLCMSCGKE